MKGLLKSFFYAFRGIGYQLCYERNFRIHCFAAISMLLLATFYRFTALEWCLLILQICLVIGAECINTAIEQTDNSITMELSKHIRRAKDSAAAGVLIFAIGAVFLGYHLFWDVAVFKEIAAYFSLWYRALLLALYFAVMLFLRKGQLSMSL